VQDEEAGGLVAVVAEGVGGAARHQEKVVAATRLLDAVEDERDGSVKHPERLGAVHVPVRKRAPAVRWHGPLHQGKVAVRLGRDGLEGQYAPRAVTILPFPVEIMLGSVTSVCLRRRVDGSKALSP
jgi:hypothetical protein